MNIFLDSSILIEILRGNLNLGTSKRLFINSIVYSEVLYGFLYINKNPILLDAFLDTNGIDILPIGKDTAGIHAAIKLSLNKLGKSLPDNDLLIAASCLEHKLSIATANIKHFNRIEGLEIANLNK